MNGLNLINTEFDFEFNGVTYKVKKATLDKVILFQNKFNELTEAKDAAIEKRMSAYCIYLILTTATPAVPDLTEDLVSKSIPDIEMADVVEYFGFMNRQKVEMLREVLQRGHQRNAPVQEKEVETGGQSST